MVSPGGVGFLFFSCFTIGGGVGSRIFSTVRFGGETLQSSPPPHGGGGGGGHPQDIFQLVFGIVLFRKITLFVKIFERNFACFYSLFSPLIKHLC